LTKLEARNAGYDPIMPTGGVPSAGMEYARRLRELKFNEAVYDLLIKQYKVAKLDETRDPPVIQILDKAAPPERRARPRRKLMVAISAVLGFFSAITAAFIMEKLEKMSADSANRSRLDQLKKYVRFNFRD